MMTDAATWSAWERREYCCCNRVRYSCGLSFLSFWEIMGRCKVCGTLLAPLEVAATSEVMFGRRAYILMASGSAGTFCPFYFRYCRSMCKLMIALTCLRVFLDGSFLIAFVSSVVALWILSA